MIGGTARVARPNSQTQARCYRCGIDFHPGKEHVESWAPCRDCREALREQGDTTVWDVRQREKAVA